MMSYYEKLLELVKSKKLIMKLILSIPRSNSHAVMFGLAQASEVDDIVNEPFFYKDHQHRLPSFRPILGEVVRTAVGGQFESDVLPLSNDDKKRNFEIGCFNIYCCLAERMSSSKSPFVLLVHEHVSNLADWELDKLLPLFDAVCLIARDPKAECVSLIVRLVNTYLTEPDKGFIIKSQALALVNKDFSFVDDAFKARLSLNKMKLMSKTADQFHTIEKGLPLLIDQLLNDLSNNWMRIIWTSFEQQSQFTTRKCSTEKISFLDTTSLSENAYEMMKGLSNRFNLTYSEDMVSNWSRLTGLNFRCCITLHLGQDALQDPWNGPARTSTGIQSVGVPIPPVDINTIPVALHALLNTLSANYEELRSHLKTNFGVCAESTAKKPALF